VLEAAMMLSEHLEEQEDAMHLPEAELYRSVVGEHQEVATRKSGYLYHSMLWAAMTPSGNIYRYLALTTERNRICADVWRQLEDLARRHAALLGGEAAPLEVRAEKLRRALEETKVHWAVDAEKGKEVPGFKPLEEYFSTRVKRLGPLLLPTDSQQLMDWLTHRAIAAMICFIQFTAPLVIFMDEWNSNENKLRYPGKFVAELRFNEVFCLGNNLKEKLHTVMGGILLQLVILIIHSYITNQHRFSQKSGLLPGDRFWYVLGNVANQVCTFLIILATPILFWNEDSPTSLAMDSLSVLFIFMLDDFAGQACVYMGKTDAGYSRAAAWQKGLLTQCPVNLSDLINPSAATAGELWSIRFSAKGELLVAEGQDGGDQRVCPRRLQRLEAAPDERTPLSQASDRDDRPPVKLWYCSSPGSGSELPGIGTAIIGTIWKVMDKFSLMVQIMLPLAWMAVNKPCGR